ncbi:hypothetical protein RI103_09330 [Paraburkholderia sp. FT54]|uniref:hypothetical protein n=1 Tax=Paraburkholderia sp. FT54 TaxID=3074437 RepID=UPI0028777735|nr:hypothetical protein [Paraburkholderia sp. FT54]WNC91525.1 hypothetical protein RI103_09330 [Paraburkholderia sp. FT54]
MTIADELEKFGNFHDWYIDIIATSKEGGGSTPNTLTLALYDQTRRATVTFCGVTRAAIEGGGLLNIVNAIEVLEQDNEAYAVAISMLERSAHFGRHHGDHIAYVFSTVGAEIAVEFDSLRIETA